MGKRIGFLSIACVALFGMMQAQPVTDKVRTYYIVDLASADTVDIYYDTVSWRTVNLSTKLPLDFYVIRYTDPKRSPDTVHGVTGIIVNDLIVMGANNTWQFDDSRVKWDGNEFKMKDRYGRKVKWEKGELKIKDWNNKYKSEEGEAKYKEEWDKIKWKEDETKVEVGTQKIKTKTKEE
ncbi:MAG TPA: hypothetical protein VEB63_08920 [Chitinophagaceae bacterium]|nr:hypothetical protein [Chitinophagaceae bacterium]